MKVFIAPVLNIGAGAGAGAEAGTAATTINCCWTNSII